jgi:Asp/Glu/hydantoin racemase
MEETDGHFASVIVTDALELDVQRASDEHVAAARLLLQRHPDVGAIVLECTNMPPYAADIARATGLPVHDFTTFVTWALSAYRRTGFTGWM